MPNTNPRVIRTLSALFLKSSSESIFSLYNLFVTFRLDSMSKNVTNPANMLKTKFNSISEYQPIVTLRKHRIFLTVRAV